MSEEIHCPSCNGSVRIVWDSLKLAYLVECQGCLRAAWLSRCDDEQIELVRLAVDRAKEWQEEARHSC